jgi:hypothetical protein
MVVQLRNLALGLEQGDPLSLSSFQFRIIVEGLYEGERGQKRCRSGSVYGYRAEDREFQISHTLHDTLLDS